MDDLGVLRALETPAGMVSATVDGAPSETVLILAHGAGAGMDHPFMQEAATGLAARGLGVVRFNFPYIEAGRKAPDRGPVLEATYEAVVQQVCNAFEPRSLFFGGKSMGGRIASYLPGRGVACEGLVFLGYPLHPPGRPDRIRDQHLYDLDIPVLFVEGTRDPFCPLPLLDEVRSRMKAPTTLLVVDDGDHSFKVRKSSGRSTADALREAWDGIASWIGAPRR